MNWWVRGLLVESEKWKIESKAAWSDVPTTQEVGIESGKLLVTNSELDDRMNMELSNRFIDYSTSDGLNMVRLAFQRSKFATYCHVHLLLSSLF